MVTDEDPLQEVADVADDEGWELISPPCWDDDGGSVVVSSRDMHWVGVIIEDDQSVVFEFDEDAAARRSEEYETATGAVDSAIAAVRNYAD